MKNIIIAIFIIFITPTTFSSKSFLCYIDSVDSFINSQPKIAIDFTKPKVKKPNKYLLRKRK